MVTPETSDHVLDQVALLAGEELVRVDLVFFLRTSSTALWPYPQDHKGSLLHGGYARMAITTRRLIFLPGVKGWLGRLQSFFYYVPGLNAVALLIWGRSPYISHQEFELQDIERFLTWKPEFSGPPAFQIDTSSWSFGLLTKRRGFEFAPEREMRQHFLAVEVAWQAAKRVSAD